MKRRLGKLNLRRWRDSGLTLVELIIALSLFVLVIALVAPVLISSMRTQQNVVDTGQANNSAQVTFAGIERGIRNAAVGGVLTSTDGHLMVAYTGGGDASNTWRCQGWYYVEPGVSENSGRLYSKLAPSGTNLTSVTPTALDGWTLSIESVIPAPGSKVFFGDATAGVTISLIATRSGNPSDINAVKLVTTVATRVQEVSGTGGCF